MKPATSEMTRFSELVDDDAIRLAGDANAYLTAFRWCGPVKESFLAIEFGGMLGVFLFCIEPTVVGVDETLWVIVGDCPPAYLVCDNAPDWVGALKGYVFEMQRWVEAVRGGQGLEGIIPVNVSPNLEHAELLAKRLAFIQNHFIDDKPLSE